MSIFFLTKVMKQQRSQADDILQETRETKRITTILMNKKVKTSILDVTYLPDPYAKVAI